ncbi:MAG TPA: MDR family MFS transporter [Candidatus Dormibacteraeota bacterium]|nr:MDR family MFS transporter [Candidatus Dormibacteraeota bacterium]
MPTIPERERMVWTTAQVRITIGLLAALFVAALDSTIVGTALPTIERELGDFALYPWIFTGYLLTSTTTVSVWGRLADLHGRRPVLLVGLGLFVGASALCGLAVSMPELVLGRTVQGIGAGAVQPVVLTTVADLFPMRQRARIQGLFSAMWAIAALVGPLLGAAFVGTIGWRWIFEINVPIGLAAGLLLWTHRELKRGEPDPGGIHYSGAVLLTTGIAALLWGLGAGATDAQPRWGLAVAGLLVLLACGVVELRARAPILPLDLLGHDLIGPAVLGGTLGGTVMFGITTYAPLYVQSGLGGSPIEAGMSISPMLIGWPLAAVVGGRILLRVGYRRLVGLGGAVLLGGTLILAFGSVAWGLGGVVLASFVCGVGLGLMLTPLMIVIQSSVPWRRRGAATALNQFARTIGGAIGVSLMGLLLTGRVQRLADTGRSSILVGTHAIFLVLVGLAMVALVVALWILQRGADVIEPAGGEFSGPA